MGVVGAGTMGAGIAQLAVLAGARTLVHDPDAVVLTAGITGILSRLDRHVERGRITASEAEDAASRLEAVDLIEGLAAADFVIEAAPESIDIKRSVFERLAGIVGDHCVLATNTSSISVTEIAAATARPERVVGMHFFNPAPVMQLVEVVAGARSDPDSLESARQLGRAMGKRVVDAADVAGFLVNRCNRPFSLESLNLLEERIAGVEQIDRIVRTVGGFRMGPFELMDLIGIDTNHSIAEVLCRSSFGEPRYRPSPLAARMVAAGALGRKSGQGWYSYESGAAEYRVDDPVPPETGGAGGRRLLVRGHLPAADAFRALASDSGWNVTSRLEDGDPWLTVDFGPSTEAVDGPRLRHLHDGSLHSLDPEAAGFHLVPPLAGATAIEFTTTSKTSPLSLERTKELLIGLGRTPEHVGDTPGLVLGRIICQLINEAAHFLDGGYGVADDVDAGMKLGVNHPRGPVDWSRQIGLLHVVTLLVALRIEPGAERYRLSPRLRHGLASGTGLG